MPRTNHRIVHTDAGVTLRLLVTTACCTSTPEASELPTRFHLRVHYEQFFFCFLSSRRRSKIFFVYERVE